MDSQSVLILLLVGLYPSITNSFKCITALKYSNERAMQIPWNYVHSVQASKETMPWSESVEPSRGLPYMNLLKTQLNLMNDLRMKPTQIDNKFIQQSSDKKNARIGNMCFKNEKFRKVRTTYFDAGESVQVLNSLWYPSYEYDLPMLGIDLISIGLNRVLCVIDFQPLHPTVEYSEKYISPLKQIRDKYPDLHGTLSGKIYDDVSFFSKQMLFGRWTDESKIIPVVVPACEEYLKAYIKLMDNAIPNNNPDNMKIVHERQRAYDVYQAVKDPAIGLFDAYFGKEWSKSFVHDFLFDLSTDNTNPSTPVHQFQLDSTGNVLRPQVVSSSSKAVNAVSSSSVTSSNLEFAHT